MAALRYGDEMGLEERALVLTERLIALDQVKEWKHLVKTELAQPEYPWTRCRVCGPRRLWRTRSCTAS